MRSGRPQLLHVASLDVLGPLRDVNLVLVLHVLREGLSIQPVQPARRSPLFFLFFYFFSSMLGKERQKPENAGVQRPINAQKVLENVLMSIYNLGPIAKHVNFVCADRKDRTREKIATRTTRF